MYKVLKFLIKNYKMVLYIIGLGLGDEKDITVRGYETVSDEMK